MKMKHGTMSIKAHDTRAGGLAPGQFEGYASVFGNVDSYGDRVLPGAFTETLKTYGEDGGGVPCYWMHRLDDPELNIGQTVKAWEDDHGLRVIVQLDLDNPKAEYVYELIKAGRVREMSFAYDVTDGADTDDAYDIKAVDLFEVSIVPIGANRETELLGVKARQLARALEDKTNNDDEADQDAGEGQPHDSPDIDETDEARPLAERLHALADEIEQIAKALDIEDEKDPDTTAASTTKTESRALTIAAALLALTNPSH